MSPEGERFSMPFSSTDEAMHYASRFYGDDPKIEEIQAYLVLANKFFVELTQATRSNQEELLDVSFSLQFCRECLDEVARLRDRYF